MRADLLPPLTWDGPLTLHALVVWSLLLSLVVCLLALGVYVGVKQGRI